MFYKEFYSLYKILKFKIIIAYNEINYISIFKIFFKNHAKLPFILTLGSRNIDCVLKGVKCFTFYSNLFTKQNEFKSAKTRHMKELF